MRKTSSKVRYTYKRPIKLCNSKTIFKQSHVHVMKFKIEANLLVFSLNILFA